MANDSDRKETFRLSPVQRDIKTERQAVYLKENKEEASKGFFSDVKISFSSIPSIENDEEWS